MKMHLLRAQTLLLPEALRHNFFGVFLQVKRETLCRRQEKYARKAKSCTLKVQRQKL